MPAVPFFLVTGFLGSGKTTLLKRLLDVHADGHRIAVVQNEFAPGAVDGAELRQTGKPFEILEINKGSVFCVCLLSDFTRSLAQLVDEHKPDAVVLEATGLADPIAVAQLLQSDELKKRVYLAHAWCILDASTFLKMEKAMVRMVHQVRVADTVVVNKIDKSPNAREHIRIRVNELNPFADIVFTSYCDFPLDRLFDDPSSQEPVAVKRIGENAAFESCGRPDIASAVVRTTRRTKRAGLEQFLKDAVPQTYRLKGFVVLDSGDTVGIQSCFGEVTTHEVKGYVGPTEIVAMGPKLDPRAFAERFEKSAA